MLTTGEDLDRNVIQAPIGSGGHATVWLARHQTLGSLHAIKFLNLPNPALADRLFREGRIQSRLQHPNLVPVTDALRIPGGIALVMPFVPGPTLSARLAERLLSEGEVRVILDGLLDGLEYAHRNGVIHRDLKPANILLAPKSEGLVPRITDFGVARDLEPDDTSPRTSSSMVLGTPAYMAPEQARACAVVDHRADLFSLDCIIYEMLTGQRAFGSADLLGVLSASASGDYIPARLRRAGVPLDLDVVVGACLQPDPSRRPTDCEAVRALLHRLDRSTSDAPSPAKAEAVALPGRPRAHQIGGAALGVAALCGLLWVVARPILDRIPVSYVHRDGRALHLDGRSMVRVPAHATLAIADALTIQAWIRPQAWNHGDFFPILDRQWRVEVTQTEVTFTASTQGPCRLLHKTPLDRWTNIAVTYVPHVERCRWYLDGVLVAEERYQEPLYAGPDLPSMDLVLGAGPTGRLEHAEGYLDDVRIWARELNPTEIRAAAQGGPFDTAALLGEWCFDEEGGPRVTDTSGAGHDGQIQGSASREPSADVAG